MNQEVKKLVKDELSGENAKVYVVQIAQFHRIQASTMFHEAAKYVRDTLIQMGLKDAKIEQFRSDGEKKYWTHISPMGWEIRSAELRMLEPQQQLLARYADIPMCLHTCSNATPPEGVISELIDLGTGTKPDEYEGKDVKGKFVLATGRAKKVHEEAVYKRGAAGVITDTLAYEMRNVRESIDIPDAHSYQAIWPTKDVADKVTFGFSLSKRQGEHLRALLREKKTVKLHAKVDARLFSSNLDIVTATIQGSSKPEEEVFLIAHLCHPQPSANDNASGSGLLMEIARTIQTLISSDKIARPKRTIRFLWVPETFGTVAFLHSHEDIPNRWIAGINLDMVGENQELCKSTLTLDRTPDSLPSYLNDLVLNLIEQSTKELELTTPFGSTSTFRYTVTPHSGGSDHTEFVDATIGVPCVMLLQWPDTFYHTNMDTIDKVSADSLKRVGWIATVAILMLANADLEDAFFFAVQTHSRGISRLEETRREAAQKLFELKDDPKLKENKNELAKALAKTGQFYRSKIEHITWREKEAVSSVKRFATSSKLDNLIQNLSESLTKHGENILAAIEETLNLIAETVTISVPAQLEETVEESETKSITPKRLFKGTLSLDTFKKVLGEKEYQWYENMMETDTDFDKKLAEITNYMDERRTLHEIIKAVSAEYTEITAQQGLKFIRDLEKTKLATLIVTQTPSSLT